MSTTRFSRALWQRQGAAVPWMLDLMSTLSRHHVPGGLRSFKATSMHRFVFSSRPRSLFVSTSAAQVADHVYSSSGSGSGARTASITRRCNSSRRHHPNVAGGSDLKRRLSSVRVSTATDEDVQAIWEAFQRESAEHLPAVLQTMLYRLVASKGTTGMMETLFKQAPPQSIEAMEWVILVHLKANRPKYAYQLVRGMYAAGQVPTLNTYKHLLKWNAKGFDQPSRRRAADKLLRDMQQRGLTPTTGTWMELLMGQAIHELPLTYLDSLLDGLTHRAAPRIKKLVQLLASRGHPALLTVIERTQATVDIDTWNMAIRSSACAGNMAAAETFFNTMPHHNAASFHTLLHGYLAQHAIDPAIRVFRSMIEQGIAVEPYIYDLFIVAYTDTPSSRHQRRHRHHDDTTTATTTTTTATTSSTPSSTPSTSSTPDEVELRIQTIRRLWRSMTGSRDSIPDHVIARMFDFYLRHNALADAEQLYWDLRHHYHNVPLGRQTQGWASNMIMAFAGRRQFLSAISLTYDMVAQGYAPNSKAIIKLIKACSKSGDLDAAKQLLAIMEETPERRVSQSCYAALKKAYKKSKKKKKP